MSINRWRYHYYTNDGCSVYQCLSCYGEWEMRRNPSSWGFCPCCGVKWEGEQKCEERDRDVKNLYLEKNQEWYGKQRLFVIEQREVTHSFEKSLSSEDFLVEEVSCGDWGTWKTFESGQGVHFKVLEALKKAREKYQKEREEEIAAEEEYEPELRWNYFKEKQYRVKIRRRSELLKRVY